MNHDILYSIRMRASCRDQHISGAERIVPEERVASTVDELISRAKQRDSEPDRISVTLDRLDREPTLLPALHVTIIASGEVASCRDAARHLLESCGVSDKASLAAIKLLSSGAAPSDGNMRGAMIIDSLTGERLEPDQERGIRASRFDWTDDAAREVTRLLSAEGLTHFRTREALALATKVAHAPGAVAELCWSDDPDYLAGYVASRSLGYARLPFMKQAGDPKGGRAFFVQHEGFELDAFVRWLQLEPVMIYHPTPCRHAASLHEYLSSRDQVSLHV